MIGNEGACTVCGQATRKLLFNDHKLQIPICSYECQNKYLEALNDKEAAKLVSRFDNRIGQAKYHLRLCWATAGAGAFVLLAGLFAKDVTVFLVGASAAAVCAFFTRYFEEKMVKFKQTRKTIST